MSCPTGKTSFSTWALADRVARATRRRREGNLSPYRCPYCGRYHTGSSQYGQGAPSRRRRLVLRKIQDRETAREEMLWI